MANVPDLAANSTPGQVTDWGRGSATLVDCDNLGHPP